MAGELLAAQGHRVVLHARDGAHQRTALIDKPARLVYLSSGMHHHADANLDDILWRKRRWNGANAYAESKLHDAMLACAIARRWPGVLSNALEPSWVPNPQAQDPARQDRLIAICASHSGIALPD